MSLEEYIRGVASNPIGQTPRTLQDVVDRRIALDRYAADTLIDTRFTPRVVWRLAWLSFRQVQLVPPLLPHSRITDLCKTYADHLVDWAGKLNRAFPADTPEPRILRQYFAESVDFWSALNDLVDAIQVGPLGWTERDVASLLWIRLCVFYTCASITQQGRPRSRREIAEILTRALAGYSSPTSIRLRVAPAIERDLKLADRWAEFCSARWESSLSAIALDPSPPRRVGSDTRGGDDLSDRWHHYLGRREAAIGKKRQPSEAR
jgi:hypothetical protein